MYCAQRWGHTLQILKNIGFIPISREMHLSFILQRGWMMWNWLVSSLAAGKDSTV